MKTILCIDDNPVDLKTIEKVLRVMDPDCRVIGVGDGVMGLQVWRELRGRQQPVQLMLVDNHMGKLNGFETISFLRKEGYEGPAFILTGDTNLKNHHPKEVNEILYKPLDRRLISKAHQSLETKIPTNDKHPHPNELDHIIDQLDHAIEQDADPLNEVKCNAPCTYLPMGVSGSRSPARIVNISRNCICIQTSKALYHNDKISIRSAPPLNLDMDALVIRHRSIRDGFIYCCEFLSIRRILV